MIYDENVKMIFLDGGCGSVDLIPYIDYKQVRKKPKLFLSYSDGTSILNAVYAQTGITTYYGQTPILFEILERFGKKFNIPVAYCDDFGHGKNHAILPIGRRALLDTKQKTLLFQ